MERPFWTFSHPASVPVPLTRKLRAVRHLLNKRIANSNDLIENQLHFNLPTTRFMRYALKRPPAWDGVAYIEQMR